MTARPALTWLLMMSAMVGNAWALELNQYFSYNMVLQHGKPTVVRGTVAKNADVTVTFTGQKKATKADRDGSWHGREALLESGTLYGASDVPKQAEKFEAMLKAEREGVPLGRDQDPPENTIHHPLFPAGGYNGTLHPLAGMALKAVLIQLGNNYPYMRYQEILDSNEPWLVMAHAITESETCQEQGKLVLGVRRGAENIDVDLNLPVMGTYSSTAPYEWRWGHGALRVYNGGFDSQPRCAAEGRSVTIRNDGYDLWLEYRTASSVGVWGAS